MWLSEPTESFPLTHAVELCFIFRYNVISAGRIKAFSKSQYCSIYFLGGEGMEAHEYTNRKKENVIFTPM